MKIVEQHIPCPCGKSSDAYCVYEDGHGYCFSGTCAKPHFPARQEVQDQQETIDMSEKSYQHINWRGITKATMAFYKVPAVVDASGTAERLIFPYPRGEKHRKLLVPKKESFSTQGDMTSPQLFGQGLFEPGSAKAITICEGEPDTLAVFQMLGSKYPVVGVSSSTHAMKSCSGEEVYKYLDSFEKIYLCFDNDAAGQKATLEVAGLFNFNKIRHVRLHNRKDALEFLEAKDEGTFTRIWWNSEKFLPEAILSSYTAFDDIIDNDIVKEGISYPWEQLQSMTYGMQEGAFVLVTAQQGIGKTEFIRAIEHHVLKETDGSVNIGVIHLEEGKARALKGLVGYDLKTPVHLPDSQVSPEQIKETLRKLTKEDNRLHVYSHFGSDDPEVFMKMLQFLAGPCNCRIIFLDHISMIVSGTAMDDERRTLDMISTQMKTIAQDRGITMVVVSHVNDDGLTRGSRNIAKVADLHIHLDRDPENSDPNVRNTTSMMIRKNRFGAHTGPAGKLVFNIDTFQLVPEEDADLAVTAKLPF